MAKKLKYLKWWDILVLTLILFGSPIYDSTLLFLNPQPEVAATSLTQASSSQNLYMIMVQGLTLLIAIGYLMWRRFDFKQWQFKLSLRSSLIGVSLFIVLALLMDLFMLVFNPDFASQIFERPWDIFYGIQTFLSSFTDLSLVAYALLNGCYEELYFIGICTAVADKDRKWVFLASLLVRFAFHTYQGLLTAIGIGLILGIVYYRWYRHKSRNLYPIFLSHAMADVVGLSLLQYVTRITI
ncbi:CPBP family intramembrane glutamic endopeptidase [Streptococcus pluranimalium]|uniref:CPBP family intramembrane glutamic endopeptidase n=1 Tax=Streptococcus pluranimalium TaxID=82348 RepID=UPI0039FC8D7A